jgi:hypothetical protein
MWSPALTARRARVARKAERPMIEDIASQRCVEGPENGCVSKSMARRDASTRVTMRMARCSNRNAKLSCLRP